MPITLRRLIAVAGAFITVASVGVVPLAGAWPGGTAAAVAATAQPGWRLAFSDDFDGSSLDRSHWATYEGPYAGASGNYWRPDDVLVSGGKLRIRIQKRSFGGRSYTSGGVSNYALSQTYGRYQFRARIPKGKGIDSYGTLWPKDGDADATLVELLAPGGESAYLTNAYGSGRTGRTIGGNFSDAFHTYTIEWSPGRFRILFDGTVWLSDSHASKVAKNFGLAIGSGDNLTGTPNASTALPAFFEVDWVRIWRYTGEVAAATATTAIRAPATTRPKPAQTTSTIAADTTTTAQAAGTDLSGGAPSTGLALATDPASQRRSAPRGLPILVAVISGVTVASSLLAFGLRRSRG
jgi:beta-glucanase (GH16 family)